jgi:CDP-3, 6-dideoxy-D-glycero-L-glycero-4-hexulose-4-reductase
VKTILVTGANGVLAKRFITTFNTEYRIVKGLRQPSQPGEIQVESWKEISTSIEFDAVVHFAGKYLVEDSAESVKIVHDAVVGTATAIVEFCKTNKTPLVALGSYFEQAPKELSPWSHYSIAKKSASKILELASTTHGIPIRYLYAYDTYGDDLTRGKIVDLLLDPTTQKLELSPGEQKLNLTHEDDFVAAVKLTLDDLIVNRGHFKASQIRNDKDEFTLRHIAEFINSKRTNQIDLKLGVKPYRKREVFNTWDCAPNVEGWIPKFLFKDFVITKAGRADGS